MKNKPATLVLMPPDMAEKLFAPGQFERLEDLCDVMRPFPCLSVDDPAVGEQCARAQLVATSWGTPTLGKQQIARLPRLKLVAHVAGSVKALLDPGLLSNGVRVTSATSANAQPVAEFTLAYILLANKRVDDWIKLYRQKRNHIERNEYERLSSIGNLGKTVGVIGASSVGRYLIKLLKRFDLRVIVSDPLLSTQEARALGVELVPLDQLLATSDIVSLNAPALPDTFHMIGKRELSLLRNGVLFINTARGSIVDHDALRAELKSGRIDAVLDVTDPEPLPADDELYELANVVMTPHISGSLGLEIHRMTDLILDEIESFISAGTLAHEVLFEQWNYAA